MALYCREKKRGHQERKQLCTHFNRLLLSPGQLGLLNRLCAGGSAEWLPPASRSAAYVQSPCLQQKNGCRSACNYCFQVLWISPSQDEKSQADFFLGAGSVLWPTGRREDMHVSVHAELCMQVTYFLGNTALSWTGTWVRCFHSVMWGFLHWACYHSLFCLLVSRETRASSHSSVSLVSWVEVQKGLTEVIFWSHALGRKLFMKGCRVGMKNGRKDQLSPLRATGKPSSAGCS